jgi:hypothetical protein
MALLISASQVARIIGMSHRCPAYYFYYFCFYTQPESQPGKHSLSCFRKSHVLYREILEMVGGSITLIKKCKSIGSTDIKMKKK